jgi:hypothetical protein
MAARRDAPQPLRSAPTWSLGHQVSHTTSMSSFRCPPSTARKTFLRCRDGLSTTHGRHSARECARRRIRLSLIAGGGGPTEWRSNDRWRQIHDVPACIYGLLDRSSPGTGRRPTDRPPWLGSSLPCEEEGGRGSSGGCSGGCAKW